MSAQRASSRFFVGSFSTPPFARPPNSADRGRGGRDFTCMAHHYFSRAGHPSFTDRNLNEFPTTDTEDRLIAAAANIGEIRTPRNG